MKAKRALANSLVIALAFVANQALHAEEAERLGLRMGMAKSEVIASVGPNSVEKDLGDVLFLGTTPQPDARFAGYVVLVPPETGLIKVVGISNDLPTNSSGEALRDKFNEFRASLEATSGKATLVFDFLILGSTWNEPGDWMMALFNHERMLMVDWQPDEEGVSMAEKACAASSETGYIMVTYEFPNFSRWKQRPGDEEDHFFTPSSVNALISGKGGHSGRKLFIAQIQDEPRYAEPR